MSFLLLLQARRLFLLCLIMMGIGMHSFGQLPKGVDLGYYGVYLSRPGVVVRYNYPIINQSTDQKARQFLLSLSPKLGLYHYHKSHLGAIVGVDLFFDRITAKNKKIGLIAGTGYLRKMMYQVWETDDTSFFHKTKAATNHVSFQVGINFSTPLGNSQKDFFLRPHLSFYQPQFPGVGIDFVLETGVSF